MPNDSEIDVLLRRHANVASEMENSEHLDADELNAFAEGALPMAARSRYVSHLADCGDCRRAVTQLTAASGRVEPERVPASESITESWWQKLGALLAPPVLRYAAFAAVLIAVVGIGFAVWQKSHKAPAGLIAENKRSSNAEELEARQPQETTTRGAAASESPAIAKAFTQSTPAPFSDQKKSESSNDNPPSPPKPVDALARNDAPSVAAGQAAAPSNNAAAPSYAPPPSTESVRVESETREREQQTISDLHGPRRGESVDKYKTMDDRLRAGDVAKGRDEDRGRADAKQPVSKEEEARNEGGAARKRSEPRTATLLGANTEARQETPKSDKAGPPEEAETRSVGGRKFTRQGNSWVDVKLKSSMSIKTIARGTDDFQKLDSGLRSIAQQFSAPVVIVWKGKAYRIQ
ncbi:MAG TPA: hypothetical protein VN696_09105 [Pyrinomonadaceae bacterium]|nr:hypothetical protein [Pyrinomonadaceae bacterium]